MKGERFPEIPNNDRHQNLFNYNYHNMKYVGVSSLQVQNDKGVSILLKSIFKITFRCEIR